MMDVEQLYEKVYSLCTARMLEVEVVAHSSEFLFFQNKCRELLKLYNRQKQNPSIDELYCRGRWEQEPETLSDSIKKAYYSVLFEDTVFGADCASEYSMEQDIRIADIEYVFKELYRLLQTPVVDKTLFEKIYEVLERLETKPLKYTEQFLLQC